MRALTRWWRTGRRSVRFRLTALYSGLFLLTGTMLLTITYLLTNSSQLGPGKAIITKVDPPIELSTQSVTGFLKAQLVNQRADMLSTLLVESAVALGVMAVLSVLIGWLMAGRVLRPLRTMIHRVRHLSEDNLHERLAVDGPQDELKDLSDTFDGLLARLESAFEAQRLFVANASHELRTPLTLDRVLIEVSLADPEPTVESLRATHERLLANSQHQERLIEALLTLARSQRGIESRQAVDLAVLVKEVVVAREIDLQLDVDLAPATVSGDPHLLERLIVNLVDNALRHNIAGGWVDVRTGTPNGWPALCVTNSGPVIRPDQVNELAQPFRRLDGERSRRRQGLGLGLSIVAAITTAHGGRLAAYPVPGGGLRVDVTLPPALPAHAP